MTSANKKPQSLTMDIALFLKENPNVFIQQPELLALVNVSDDRSSASFLEHQVKALKDKIKSAELQQQQLVDIVRENEKISDNFASIQYQLIACKDKEEFNDSIPALLKSTFNIDEVSVISPQGLSDEAAQAYATALARITKNKTICDNKLPSAVMSLFFTGKVKSAALIPLHADAACDVSGILALGSSNEARYTPELSTDHLNRLGLMAGICLNRLNS